MEMIDKYITLVGQNLPAKISEDIQKEIRSVIEDMLEDESRSTGRPVDEEMVVAVLKRMGKPEKVAASYLPPRYLIGPDLFPHFITTLKIVLTVVTVLAMVGLGFGLVLNAGTSAPGETILRILSGMFGAVFQAAAVVTLIFAIFQWAGTELNIQEKPFDPRVMKLEDDPQKIKVAERITDIVFTILLLAVLNFFPEWTGISNFKDGVWLHAPLLTDAFFRYLPLINAVFVLDLIKNALLLSAGRWTNPLRWYSAFVSVATIVLAAWMLTEPLLAVANPAVFNQVGLNVLDPDTQALASRGMNTLVRMVISIVLVIEVVELFQNLYRLFIKGRLPVISGTSS